MLKKEQWKQHYQKLLLVSLSYVFFFIFNLWIRKLNTTFFAVELRKGIHENMPPKRRQVIIFELWVPVTTTTVSDQHHRLHHLHCKSCFFKALQVEIEYYYCNNPLPLLCKYYLLWANGFSRP